MLKIGPYTNDPNVSEEEAYVYVDHFGMAVNREPTDHGRGDSIGGTADMYFVYNDTYLLKWIPNLWRHNYKGEFKGTRHPEYTEEMMDDRPMSRDHYINTLFALKLYNLRHNTDYYDYDIRRIHKNTGWKISKKARKTLSVVFWSNAILGSKFNEFLYYLFDILAAIFIYIPIHKLGMWIAGFEEEVDQAEWQARDSKDKYLQHQPKWKTVIDDIMFPSYALFKVGWMMYVLNGLPRMKRFTQKLYLIMVGKTNYVQQMMLGVKNIPRDKVESFKPMKGGRWSIYLSTRNDRVLQVLKNPPKYNNLDVDLVRKLYNETQL